MARLLHTAPRVSGATLKLAACYFATCVLAVKLTRFEGGVACVWVAGAVLIAALNAAPARARSAMIAACWAGSFVATGVWGVGWKAAPIMATTNVAEGIIAVALLARFGIGRTILDSLPDLALFVLAVGILPPILTAPCAAAAVTMATGTAFEANLRNWFVAHALGALTFTPVCSMIARGHFHRWWRVQSVGQIARGAALLALLAATTAAVFLQARYPLLFLPMVPLMFVTFRIGRVGSAIGIGVVAAIGGVATIHGLGPIVLIHGSRVAHAQFFQLYMAVTWLTVLPASADLANRRRLYAALRDSEARFRMLLEHSSDVVVSLRPDGSVSYSSPSLQRQLAHDPEALRTEGLGALLSRADCEQVTRAHRDAMEMPGETFTSEFSPAPDRWYEASLRAVVDEDGMVTGTVGTLREVTRRRLREAELAHAAATDALTGLANRRLFDERVSRAMLSGVGGCVAVFDVDHFKRVNDTHGHAAGDEVLKVFAARAARQFKVRDLVARIGGEEFGILFEGADEHQAMAACERLREFICDQPVGIDGTAIRITVSGGVASMAAARDAVGVLRLADEALYRAKRLGRDRVERAEMVAVRLAS